MGRIYVKEIRKHFTLGPSSLHKQAQTRNLNNSIIISNVTHFCKLIASKVGNLCLG